MFIELEIIPAFPDDKDSRSLVVNTDHVVALIRNNHVLLNGGSGWPLTADSGQRLKDALLNSRRDAIMARLEELSANIGGRQ